MNANHHNKRGVLLAATAMVSLMLMSSVACADVDPNAAADSLMSAMIVKSTSIRVATATGSLSSLLIGKTNVKSNINAKQSQKGGALSYVDATVAAYPLFYLSNNGLVVKECSGAKRDVVNDSLCTPEQAISFNGQVCAVVASSASRDNITLKTLGRVRGFAVIELPVASSDNKRAATLHIYSMSPSGPPDFDDSMFVVSGSSRAATIAEFKPYALPSDLYTRSSEPKTLTVQEVVNLSVPVSGVNLVGSQCFIANASVPNSSGAVTDSLLFGFGAGGPIFRYDIADGLVSYANSIGTAGIKSMSMQSLPASQSVMFTLNPSSARVDSAGKNYDTVVFTYGAGSSGVDIPAIDAAGDGITFIPDTTGYDPR